MNKLNKLTGCLSFFTVQKILSGKWALLILYLLREKPLRFNELQRMLGDLTHATLTKQLRALEEHELINRKVYNQIPPKVEYSLSEQGKKLIPSLNSLLDWGEQYVHYRNDTNSDA